ncbi:MAG: hypothetical protein KC776_35120 [Myxococcales bacterium]|nr:hypothetical protein [Myxococcales bacterium]MCB9578808.1 hypothetical protein [Polyangiaceae bacterium]
MRRLIQAAPALFVALGVAVGCASIAEEGASTDAGCYGPACTPTDAGKDQISADVPVPDSGTEAGPPTINPLCGSGCLPDDPYSCVGGFADGGGPSGDAGAGQASAEAGLPPPMAGADAGAGVSEAGPAPAAGCFVKRDAGEPVTECAPAGTGGTAAPCVSSSDCAPGFACVGEGSAAQCRPFCCSGASACESGTYCAERGLRDDSMGATPQMVPVCIQADDCSLDEPYPCPPNKQCKCKEGTACTVVSSDGTTSCVQPGTGQAGEACPCAPGHVCSLEKKTCIKICSTDSAAAECGSGKCQSVSYLPKGFGVCVLTATDGG